ncbi:tricarballylate dehydrogenase [Botrimarina colliarenosi]|uniref:Tricarballylate dehydrogenase n=1 Tax=Botrimarina colliarenosi TaxID=2528001 RepID=A0A5C6A261_9BACT|nr:FAD-dependent oxidoreductase [Botrimarina colliarenosi]TWT93430.1 tricarballylate dehydrogenase [Botrimarina colliarenosi]
MKQVDLSLGVAIVTVFLAPLASLAEAPRATDAARYDVVIAGGSTAALAAAFSAAEEGATVALLEPTDWIGGQLTSSAVPAVDEAWHKITASDGRVLLDVAAVARDPRNMTPFFRDALAAIGNPGGGWVSRYCFEPRRLLDGFLEPRERELAGRLTVYRETVVKQVETDGRRVTAIVAVRRTPRDGVEGYDRLPSQELADWYSPADSSRFTKETLRIEGDIFIDATEWGEVLALADAPYLQGAEPTEDSLDGDDTLGQATVYCFVQRMHDRPIDDHPSYQPVAGLGYGPYHDRADAWSLIWTYRRVLGDGPTASAGELSLQNWGYSATVGDGGNDYPFGYLFVTRDAAAAARDDWRGGVDPEVLAAAEARALAWHDWFRHAAPAAIDPDQITLDGEALGTHHGLAKLPYIRDTRRSIGVDGFVLKLDDLVAEVEDDTLPRLTGTKFRDRVALGAYAADIHPLVGYEYPPDLHENHATLPFYLPLRSLTNDGFDNLLVAGKTMAQTFLANTATRLHPIEWSSGTACGVVAADLAESGATAADACKDFERLRTRIARYTPVDWTLPEPISDDMQ